MFRTLLATSAAITLSLAPVAADAGSVRLVAGGQEQDAASTEPVAQPETTAAAPAEKSDEKQQFVDQKSVSLAALLGTRVFNDEQVEIGQIGDVILGPKEDSVKAYIVSVGGFLGLGEKRVAFSATGLDIFKDESGGLHIYTSVTESTLDEAPEYDEEVFRVNPNTILIK